MRRGGRSEEGRARRGGEGSVRKGECCENFNFNFNLSNPGRSACPCTNELY